MKRLIIEQLKEGFLFSDENDDMYAVSSGTLSKRVLAYFGLTRHDSHKEIGTKNHIAPPAKVSDPKETRTQSTMTPDSHSGGATSQSQSTEQSGGNPASGGIDNGEKPIPSELKLGTRDNTLHPSDLKIAKFDYDLLAKTRKYKTMEVLELPDDKVVLKYGATRYYSTKEKVMQIPFPFQRGQFNKENGWSSTVEQAFKMYRKYLAERKEPEGQPDGTCDDVSFDICANNDPETCKFCVNESRYEDKRKLAAKKPRAPLLKASMGV